MSDVTPLSTGEAQSPIQAALRILEHTKEIEVDRLICVMVDSEGRVMMTGSDGSDLEYLGLLEIASNRICSSMVSNLGNS